MGEVFVFKVTGKRRDMLVNQAKIVVNCSSVIFALQISEKSPNLVCIKKMASILSWKCQLKQIT